MRRLVGFLLLATGCASSASPPPPVTPAPGRAPYEAPPAGSHSIEIRIDVTAAREILATLSRPQYEATDEKLLRDLPAVRLAIEDSGRSAEIFARDLAAAFEEKTGAAVFDFRSIREERVQWNGLLEKLSTRQEELAKLAARRAAALLPADRPVTLQLHVQLSFGLAGLADHLLVSASGGRELMILDVARALGEVQNEPIESQLSRMARLIAGGAHRKAWAAYREVTPAWKERDPTLGDLEPLLRVVAEAGPSALFSVDENFFPLTVWLKEPMKRNLSEFNRTAERLVEAEENLEARMELVAAIRRPEFARRLAGPTGAFLSDAIFQASGIDALRGALSKGPRAFFEAYEKASQEGRDVLPLSRVIQDRLAAKPSATP